MSHYRMDGHNIHSCDFDSVKYTTISNHESCSPQNSLNNNNNNNNERFNIERESKSLVDLASPIKWVSFSIDNEYEMINNY